MRRLIVIIFCAALLQCQKVEITTYPHYDIQSKIEPSKNQITVSLQMNYFHQFEPTDSLSFLLYKKMNIESLESDMVEHFVFDTMTAPSYRYTPEAGILKIKLKKAIAKDDLVTLRITYYGQIGRVNYWQTNRLTEEWTELGNYTPWFPYHPQLKLISFKIDAVIEDDYTIEGNGEIDSQNNHWIIKNGSANNDIILCASKNFISEQISGRNHSLKFTSTVPFSKTAIDSILATGNNILNNFSHWFGEIEMAATKILVTPRETGGGYARKGIIVLSKMNEEDYSNEKAGYVQYFAHEFSHFWWSNAPTDSWEDWLNEAFAEYSAMLSVRDLIGDHEFEKRIQKKSVHVDSLPPVRGIDRDDPKAYDVLYNKGCYLLYTLEKDVGKEKFMAFLRSVYLNKISRTDDLIRMMADQFGEDIAKQFNAKLDK